MAAYNVNVIPYFPPGATATAKFLINQIFQSRSTSDLLPTLGSGVASVNSTGTTLTYQIMANSTLYYEVILTGTNMALNSAGVPISGTISAVDSGIDVQEIRVLSVSPVIKTETVDLHESWTVVSGVSLSLVDFHKAWASPSDGPGAAEVLLMSGNDTIIGSVGNNTLLGGRGTDVIDGREGSDTARYDRDALAGGNAGITVDLQEGRAIDGFGDFNSLVSIENIIGTDRPHPVFAGYSDLIIGSAGSNTIDARGGNDIVQAGDGDDLVLGGTGNDYLFAGGGNDTINGGAGNDVIAGDVGNNSFQIDLQTLIGGQIDTILDFEVGKDAILAPSEIKGQIAFGDGYLARDAGGGKLYWLSVPGVSASQIAAAMVYQDAVTPPP